MQEILTRIKLLILDVDGVLTDGSITWTADEREIKSFHVRDGLGIRVWQKLGFQIAILSGRVSEVVDIRAKELGIAIVEQGIEDKLVGLDSIVVRSGVSPAEMACMGDDWPDLPVMRRCGYSLTVADAPRVVQAAAHYTTHAPGGRGAVREAIEHLLAHRGLLDKARRLYDTE
jgi:3-deoxy-D-manno-octulosonate 8-phosphate phosphatase (KDO 8-P phosphatase)